MKNYFSSGPLSKASANQSEIYKPVVTKLKVNIQKAAQPDFDLDNLCSAVDELPELDTTKIVALDRRIGNGHYKVDSKRLADKLIELESSLDSR